MTLTLADTLPATASKQDDANTALAQILGQLQAQRAETVWTDNTGAYFIRLDNGGTISWVTPAGTASSGPGTGAKPVGSGTVISDTTRWQAINALAGAYTVGDYLSHVVTTDTATGIVLANFWVNISTGHALGAAPASADIGAIAPLPAGAATTSLQTTANALLTAVQNAISASQVAATSVPLAQTISDTNAHVLGPFTPQIGRAVLATLNATASASGSAQLLKSSDGGTTKVGITAGGLATGAWPFTNATGAIVNEAVDAAISAADTYYLAIQLTGGTVAVKIYQ